MRYLEGSRPVVGGEAKQARNRKPSPMGSVSVGHGWGGGQRWWGVVRCGRCTSEVTGGLQPVRTKRAVWHAKPKPSP